MFTDGPVTPTRVETLVNVLRKLGNRKFDREKLSLVLQPRGLPGVRADSNRDQAVQTFTAAKELGLITVDENGRVQIAFDRNDARSTRQIVLDGLDKHVLGGSPEPEPYFALFYSFLLSLGPEGTLRRSPDEWALEFDRVVFAGQRQQNPFNPVKYQGLRRWFRYAGLGWHDSSDVFQPDPFPRLERRLPVIFGKNEKLRSEEFMERLGQACPELDGGEVFRRAAPNWNPVNKRCSLGLSHTLVELHLESKIRLHCPQDSRGWSIAEADPPTDETLQSDRIEIVAIL